MVTWAPLLPTGGPPPVGGGGGRGRGDTTLAGVFKARRGGGGGEGEDGGPLHHLRRGLQGPGEREGAERLQRPRQRRRTGRGHRATRLDGKKGLPRARRAG